MLIAQANAMSSLLLMATGAFALLYLGDARLPGRHGWLPPALAAEAAVLLQVKFSIGLAVAAHRRGVRGLRRPAAGSGRPRWSPAAGCWPPCWPGSLAGQALTDYPGWFAGSVRIAAGYTEAMSLEDKPNVLPYLLVAAVLAVVAGYFLRGWRAKPDSAAPPGCWRSR